MTSLQLSFIITHALAKCAILQNVGSEKYSRGRRGAPAKGVGRATGARVQIPLSPLFSKEKKIKKVVDKTEWL